MMLKRNSSKMPSLRHTHQCLQSTKGSNAEPRWRLLPKVHHGLFAFLILLAPASVFAESTEPTVPTATPAPIDPLGELVEKAIATTSNRFLDAKVHTPWQIVHGLLALRQDYVINNGGTPVNAIEWISNGASFHGAPWFEATTHGGRAHPYNGTPYEFEGHVNQFLAVLSMCDLPLDHEFKAADGKTVTMQQMVDHAKMAVSSHVEITWTLWFLTHYVDQDEEWLNENNEPWSMERLVRMQVKDSPYDSPCGGTHGMFALAYARNAYLKKHGQLRGAWLEADQKLQRYLMSSQRMQNRDGSFATDWFKSTGYSDDFNDRIKYSGHMLEWILVAQPKSRLQDRWIRTGIQTLCYDLIRNAREPADCGPLYHALHALVLYREQTNPDSHPLMQPSVARAIKENATPGPLTLSDKPSDEAVPAPFKPNPTIATPTKTIQQPVKMATQPEGFRSRRRRARRRTSSIETPQQLRELGAGKRPLMPILKNAGQGEVASATTSES